MKIIQNHFDRMQKLRRKPSGTKPSYGDTFFTPPIRPRLEPDLTPENLSLPPPTASNGEKSSSCLDNAGNAFALKISRVDIDLITPRNLKEEDTRS